MAGDGEGASDGVRGPGSWDTFRHLADHAQDVIVIYRLAPRRAFQYVSPAITALTGYTADELYADPELRYEIFHPEALAAFRFAMGDHRDAGTPLPLRWRHRDGHDVWVEARGRVTRDADGRPATVEAIVRDVTAQHLAAQAVRAALEDQRAAAARRAEVDRLHAGFLQAVSHELRTPLTSIVGFSELLSSRHDELDADREQQLVDGLLRNARRLESLVTDLLDVDRLRRGVLTPHRTTVAVEHLVTGTLAGLDLDGRRVEVVGDGTALAHVDVARSQRVVEHLVVNAIRHTPAGSPIRISYRSDGTALRLTVEDEGPGVPDADKQVLFEPFRRGDTPATRSGAGVGIGLSVVAHFARLHGGRAWVEDRPGGGARFQVLLPAAVPALVAS